MHTYASLKDFSKSDMPSNLSLQFVNLHLLISVCTQFHHLFLVSLLVKFPEDDC
jgi:hypothetical protein